MKKTALVILILLAVTVAGPYGVMVGARYLLFGRFPTPTVKDFAAIAQKNRYLVQAAYDYKADNGMWPQKFADLTPKYLPAVPGYPAISLDNHNLSIATGFSHSGICYCFQTGKEGWSANGDFGIGALPLPRLASTRPTLSGDELIRARLAEYDRLIALNDAADSNYYTRRNYTQKIVFLLSISRKADALQTCHAAEAKFPDWWRPVVAAAAIADPDESPQEEIALRDWVERFPAFIHCWYLSRYYRDHNKNSLALEALRSAVKHSLADTDPDLTWVPDAFAFDAADYACRQRQPELVLDITRLWALPRGVYDYHNDNLDVFRAAAELQLGHFDDAAADLDRVMKKGNTGALWAHHLDQIHQAIMAKDKSFTYDAGTLPAGWSLLPPLD